MTRHDPLLSIPAWAKETLKRPPSAFDQAELDTLREFFASWERLHALPNDQAHRKQKEEAAQKLVAQSVLIRRMRGD